MKTCLEYQVVNNNMTVNEKKGINQPLLFDTVPIENYIFSLLHAEISVCNKIVENHFLWITERIEKMSEEEVILTNCLIHFKIELKKQQLYDEWINNNSSVLASLRIVRLKKIHVENSILFKNTS